MAATALNQVSPVVASGELLKGSMISHEVKPADIVASLAVYHYLNVWMMLGFTALGPLLALLFGDLPRPWIGAMFGVSGALAAGWALIGFLLRRGLGGKLVRFVGRLRFLRPKKAEALERRAAEVDRRIKEFRRERPKRFRRALLFATLPRLTVIIEAFVVLSVLAPDIAPGHILLIALLTQSAQQMINWVAVFVPGRIGVAEGGLALLYEQLGLDPVTGLSFAVLRRMRKLLAAGAGFAVGTYMEATRRRESPAPEAAPVGTDSASEAGPG
jgi:hypothetical protein